MTAEFPGAWWCSICGSERIERSSIQASLGDPLHPLGLCWDCRGTAPMPGGEGYAAKKVRRPLSPLIRPEEWRPKVRKVQADAKPEDVWGGLPAEERQALTRPVR